MGERKGTKALELWCKRMTEGYPGVKIENMTTSWKDGLAFCAMIHHFRPDLIDFDKLNKEDVYHNNDLAFRTAERHLGIPALLDADDMASYEVPDRLSILTYLAQFYQVFAAQDSPNRFNNKRNSNVIEKNSITKPTGPPSKMAHVVGVPKREPCQKCSLPVFLAERLTVGKKVYHRTCLKCARCNSQLTPGSFYETETDDEYCCETCPDEEKSSLINHQGAISTSGSNVVASSPSRLSNTIAERLAFFENRNKNDSSKGLLQKSLSDEEKSQSLKKFEENQNNLYQTNPAFSEFLNNFSNSSDVTDSNEYATEDDNDDLENHQNSDMLPELPNSQPPKLLPQHISFQQQQTEDQCSSILDNNENKSLNKQNKKRQQQQQPNMENSTTKDPSIASNKLNTIDIATDDGDNVEQNEKEQSSTNLDDNINCNVKKNVNITKDSCEDDQTYEENEDGTMKIINPSHVSDDKIDLIDKYCGISNQEEAFVKYDNNKESKENSNVSNMVRARLHHFEVITNNKKISENTISNSSSSIVISTNNKRISSIVDNNNEEEAEGERTDGEDHVSNDDNYCKNKTEVPKTLLIENWNDNKSNILNVQENINEKDIKSNEEESLIESNKERKKIEYTQHLNVLDNENKIGDISDKRHADEEDTDFTIFAKKSVMSPSRKIPLSKELEISKRGTLRMEDYPEELNPFKSDEEDDERNDRNTLGNSKREKRKSLNPFESNEENYNNFAEKIKPSRPPLPTKLFSTNPFGSETEDDDNQTNSSGTTPSKRTPVPTPRSHNISKSQNPTPEPTPRITRQNYGGTTSLRNTGDYYNSIVSLTPRDNNFRGSTQSLSSCGSITGTRKKIKKGPAPPPPIDTKTVKELFQTTESDSKKSSPSSSNAASPKPRKKRPAPVPPTLSSSSNLQQLPVSTSPSQELQNLLETSIKSNSPIVDTSQLDKLSDEEKERAILENCAISISSRSSNYPNSLEDNLSTVTSDSMNETTSSTLRRRLIALDASLVEDSNSSHDLKLKEEENVVYRRKIIPSAIETPTKEEKIITSSSIDIESEDFYDRQLEKLKDNKEAKNRNRQSHISLNGEDGDPLLNKSIQGKWKRRKGPAPALPIPPRRVLQMLPLQEIRHELEVIEVQQQGLEKQGVILEKMIRDRCEGQNSEDSSNPKVNSKEVEDLILQLFELVNEKNELFRRQAELMYLRRQHRLEQEQADLEYEIRVLMAQPERNKTDSDKAREESLITRLVEVVQLRNEVVECLEMDRLREAEEDMSIKERLEMHTAKRDEELSKQTPIKLSKKEKKKQKELKKLCKSKKLDVDKDADESEISLEKQKSKKKKFLFYN